VGDIGWTGLGVQKVGGQGRALGCVEVLRYCVHRKCSSFIGLIPDRLGSLGFRAVDLGSSDQAIGKRRSGCGVI
jgi:hypothetical protein